jgi:hypothetical protein
VVGRIVIDSRNANTVLSAGGFSADNVYRTTNAGANWADASGSGATDLPNAPVYSLAINPAHPTWLYAGTEVGLFASEDSGTTWALPTDGPANVSVEDLFWMNSILVAPRAGAVCSRPSTESTLARRTRFDVDGDGKADLLWRNTSSGQNAVWFINGTAYNGAVGLPPTTPDWLLTGEGDFNADGKADILWRNSTTGDNAIWLLSGAGFSSGAGLLAVADTNWKVVGTGDFNADHKTDLLWRNSVNGNNAIWLLDGATIIGSGRLPPVAT